MPLAISLQDFLTPLALFGFAAQGMFMLRFVVQWLVSERAGRSTVPVAFWYLSLLGGVMLFAYAAIREDVVIMTGQALGVVIYSRNLVLIYRERARLREWQLEQAAQDQNSAAAPPSNDGKSAAAPGVEGGAVSGEHVAAGRTDRG